MKRIFKNATLVDWFPARMQMADLCVESGRIVHIGTNGEQALPSAENTDCTGRIICPGLVIGHTHLYSSLAVGMPPPRRKPTNFLEILDEVWWKLDRALDEESVYVSALVGAAKAVLCGSTTLIDHHASPNAITGSLDRIKEALETVGIRGVLCYEVTDRNGADGTAKGLEENARFLGLNHGSKFSGLVGAHASFTLSDSSLEQIADLADNFQTGIHIHVAEDEADIADSMERSGLRVIDRLARHRVLREGSLFAHCTHLTADEITRIRDANTWMAHNTRSNMNNAVGYAPIEEMAKGNLILGTDGIDGDMFAESRVAWLKSRDAKADIRFGAPIEWAAGSAQFAGRALRTSLGKLEVGAAADLVVLDYDCYTPMTAENLSGHWFFGLSSRNVESVICEGEWVVKNRRFVNTKIYSELLKAQSVSKRLWQKMQELQ